MKLEQRSEPQRDLDAPLTDYERYLMEKFFSDPEQLPVKFKNWVADYVATNGSFHVSSLPTLKGEEWRDVGDVLGFSNSWVDYDSDRPARFCKDALGWVHLEGIIKSGTVPAAAFTLPVGYRPGHVGSNAHFIVDANNAAGFVQVNVDGVVNVGAGSNVYVSLAQIHFRAAA